MIPPLVPFLSSDILLFSWLMLASGSGFFFQRQHLESLHVETKSLNSRAGRVSTHYEGLFVNIVHVQSHQVLPAAQIQATLILIHEEDAVVAGVEGETEGSCCPCVHQFCK